MAGSAIQRTTSAVKTDNEILALIYTTNVYKRNVVFSGGANTDAASRRSLVTPADMIVGINGSFYRHTSSSTLDLNTAGNWNSSETTYATAANRAGKDVYIYACESGSTAPDIVLSCDSSYPDDYTAATSRKVGGFHCLCASVGTISGHDLTGYLQGDILPLSVWDLLHRAKSNNEGMVWSEKAGIWVDIYLASGTGSSTVSEYGGTISDSRNWMDFVDDFAAVNKRLLDDDEFATIAAGSNEETNISGSANPVTTGGHSDTASQRMISDIGCEDCCGALWQWLRTSSARLDDSTAGGYIDLDGSKGSFYTYGTNGYGNTQLLAGGYWSNGSYCGSRARYAGNYRWIAGTGIGARGRAEPRVVHLD